MARPLRAWLLEQYCVHLNPGWLCHLVSISFLIYKVDMTIITVPTYMQSIYNSIYNTRSTI